MRQPGQMVNRFLDGKETSKIGLGFLNKRNIWGPVKPLISYECRTRCHVTRERLLKLRCTIFFCPK